MNSIQNIQKFPKLILASTSIYRQELLTRLGIPFQAEKPSFDEDSVKKSHSHLKIDDLCRLLAKGKAQSLSTPENCVIGSDQMAVLEGQRLGKPGNYENALAQLLKMQGKSHELLTSVTVFFKGEEHSLLDRTILKMRPLASVEIEKYLKLDQPFDCAGSYKIEKHGISLFEKIQTEDFTAIPGLPLIKLGKILRELGYSFV
jgi:septum formation protein